jgi:hypothetical protein
MKQEPSRKTGTALVSWWSTMFYSVYFYIINMLIIPQLLEKREDESY